MKKNIFLSCCMVLLMQSMSAQINYFAGINGSYYGSVLYNHNDWNADARLDYEVIATSSHGLEIGMQGKAGAGITLGIEKSEIAQRYKGIQLETTPYTMLGITRLNYIKVPLGIQLSSDPNSKASLLINGGVFYAMLTGSSDQFTLLYDSSATQSYSYTLKNKNFNKFDVNGTQIESNILNSAPYKRTITGAHIALGAAFRMLKRVQVAVQVKSEFTFNDLENKEQLINSETSNTFNFYENTYAKYTAEQGTLRAKTNLYSLGVQLKARYYFTWKRRKSASNK